MNIYRKFDNIPILKEEVTNDVYVPYVIMDNLFSEKELDVITGLWNNEKAIDTKVYNNDASLVLAPELRKSKKTYIHAEGNEWIYDKIGTACLMMNATRFRFALWGFHGPLAYNIYGPDNYFTWHMDYAAKINSNRKLVVCIQLSRENEYEGGDLELISDVVVPRKRGSFAIFPSYLVHRVSPIISGCRKSLVAHIAGPPFH